MRAGVFGALGPLAVFGRSGCVGGRVGDDINTRDANTLLKQNMHSALMMSSDGSNGLIYWRNIFKWPCIIGVVVVIIGV